MTPPVQRTFQIRLEEPATPARVAAVATFVERLFRTTFPAVDPNDVTLTIDNYAMTAEARARSSAAADAMQQVLSFLARKPRTMAKHPHAAALAGALADRPVEMNAAQVFRGARGKALVRLDGGFVKKMRAIADRVDPPLRGTTTVRSVVYRVGRASDDARLAARILIEKKNLDVGVEDGLVIDKLFAAARHGRAVELTLNATWIRGLDGRLSIDARRSMITKVDERTSMTGRELLDVLDRALPSGVDVEAWLIRAGRA
ncbi:MAG: hypothetical protein ACHREM_18130 [Polyangiales bacterium]